METLALNVVTPRRQVVAADTLWVELPAASGQMRALPGHAPTLGSLGAGVVRYESATGGELQLAVSGGFLEVQGGKLTLLADHAELPADVNRTAARTELERLRQQPPVTEDADAARARQDALDFAQARVAITS